MPLVSAKCPNCQADTMADNGRKQCYCIYCGYKYDVNSTENTTIESVSQNDGLVNVSFSTSVPGYIVTVEIDGKEVCALSGSSETVRITPGKHTIHAKASSLIGGQIVGELKEGSKVSIDVGFMGLKLKIM